MILTRATLTGPRLTASRVTYETESGRFVYDWGERGEPILSPEGETVSSFLETYPGYTLVLDGEIER